MGFTKIENRLLYAANLSGQAKYLATLIMSKEDGCLDYEYIAAMSGWKRTFINKTLKELIERKIISKKRRFSASNIYTVLPSTEWEN
jgi:predicted transcriptional regulator